MARSPILETTNLRIVPFSEEFLTERYVGWLNDLEVVRFSQQRNRTHTLASCRDYLASFDGTPNHFWAIVSRDPAQGHIGNMNAYVDTTHQVADLGILIGERSVWGRGYGTEAWMAVCDYLFRSSDIRKITAGALAVNSAMAALARKAGMIEDGRRIRQYLFEGAETDVVHWALFKKDWIKRNAGGIR
jgi:ribosomal-protein-alanine N-acetyltransferase